MDPLVSVIIPTFGRAALLRKAIDSVLSQSYKNYEIIVVDDNNPNTEDRLNTESLMREYTNNTKVTYLQHEKNMNGAVARNTGIAVSKGEYISFLDDDDFFLTKKIEKQVLFLKENEEFDAVYCGYIRDMKNKNYRLSGNLTKELLLLSYEPITPTLMFSRKSILILEGFNPTFIRHQDYELMIRFFKNFKVGFVEEYLVELGKNNGENALEGSRLEDLKKYFFSQFRDVITELNEEDKGVRDRIYVIHYSRVFLNHINHKNYKMGFSLFRKFMLSHPLAFSKQVTIDIFEYFKKKLFNEGKYGKS